MIKDILAVISLFAFIGCLIFLAGTVHNMPAEPIKGSIGKSDIIVVMTSKKVGFVRHQDIDQLLQERIREEW